MKTLLLLAALFAQAAPIYVYPVRVQIVTTTRNVLGHGSGRANFYDESLGIQGFDFVYQGCRQIIATPGKLRDQARWKSKTQLVIVNPENSHECIVDVTFRDYVYVMGEHSGEFKTQPFGKPGPHQGHQ